MTSNDAPEWLVEVCRRMGWSVAEWQRVNYRETLPFADERVLTVFAGHENAGDIWTRRVPWWMTSLDEGTDVIVICSHTDGRPMLCVCEFASLKESYDVTGVASVADVVQSFGMLAKAHDIDEDEDDTDDTDTDNAGGM